MVGYHGAMEEACNVSTVTMKTKLANVRYTDLPIPKGTESVNESIAVVFRPYAPL